MKTEHFNLTVEEIETVISNKGADNFDSILNTGQITACRKFEKNEEVSIIYEAKNEDLTRKRFQVDYDRWAFSQLCSRFQVPLQFYDRCSPKLKREIFLEHINARKKDMRFRFASTVPEVNWDLPQRVRAVLSPSYTVVDDKWLFPLILKILEKQDVIYYNFSWDTHLTRLMVKFPDLAVRDENNTLYKGGLLISNSETGNSAIWAEPTVFVGGYHIVNRRSLAGQGLRTRLVHRGLINKERVTPLIEQAREIAQMGIIQLMEAQESLVKRVEALKYAERIDVLPKRMYDILAEEWENDREISKLAAAQRILNLARELPLFQRIALEQAAGAYTGIFNKYESRIAQLIGEINE